MKTLLITLTMFFISYTCKSQYTLTASNNTPKVGDVVSYSKVDYIGLIPSSGSSQVWDYSYITTIGSFGPEVYESMASVPNKNLFPTATISKEDGSVYQSNNGFTLLGYAAPDYTDCIVMSNPMTLYKFPFAYNSSWSDSFKFTILDPSESFTVSGTTQCTGDGKGTLKLPNNRVVNNVLKVKKIETYNVDYGFATIVLTYTTNSFYSSLSKFPLFEIQEEYDDYGAWGDPEYYRDAKLNDIFEVGLFEHNMLKNEISVYPNPAKDYLNVKGFYGMEVSGIEIVDVMGRKVLEQKENTTQINIEGLNKGIYQILITSEGKSYSSKFIKE